MVVFTIGSCQGYSIAFYGVLLLILISRVCGVYFCMYLYCHLAIIIWYLLHI